MARLSQNLFILSVLSIRRLEKTPFFEHSLLQIRGLGVAEEMPPCFVERPAGTGDFLLMLFHDPVRFGPPESRQKLGAGALVLWRPEDGHFYGEPQTRWSHSWLHFSGEIAQSAVENAAMPAQNPQIAANPARFERYLLDLYEELSGPFAPQFAVVKNALENLLHVAALPVAPRQRAISPAILAAKTSIETRYAQPLTLEKLASEAHLSAPHFCTQFRRAFGVSPVAALSRRRLEIAAFLLRETSLGAKEIAARVGYSDLFVFSKNFKRAFGVSPRAFRNREAS